MTSIHLLASLQAFAHPENAQFAQRFFKTGKGEYAEGDIFLGLNVPQTRKIAREFQTISYTELQKVIMSPLHEARLCALIILTHKYKNEPEKTYRFYLKNTRYINNWDLVDVSADKIIGEYLWDKDQSLLTELARSSNLWERRIALLATFAFIKKGNPHPTLLIAALLLKDQHDLIHKAAGWMLREVGKRCSQAIEEEFLQKHATSMPRTMLRYAIERFPETKRKEYLSYGR